MRWEDLPEWLRADMRAPLDISPGEFVGIGGGEEDFGIQMPTISHRYLDGLWVLRNMPGEVHPNDLAELEHEVSIIRAAKEGTVIVKVASNVRFAKEDELSEEDRLFITAAFTTAAGDTMAVVFEGYETAWLPLDALTEELVDDDLVEELEFFASGDKMMPSYVIEDSERARAALEKRLGS